MLTTETLSAPQIGSIVSGTVVMQPHYGVFVDIGMEKHALLEVVHMVDFRKNGSPKVGDTIRAVIIDFTNGYARLSVLPRDMANAKTV